jgi:DNA-directed RNA polymerase specialized sigma24 family protein
MEEHEVVAAIVAGDPSGLTEALDKYAEPLFAYCRSILPQAEAADVVGDTFVIARVKLDGLRDPGKLGIWLHAVARNECQRRLSTTEEPPQEPAVLVPGSQLFQPQIPKARPSETQTPLSQTLLSEASLSETPLSETQPSEAPLSEAQVAGAQVAQLSRTQLPEGLTGRIMKVCTDETPTGRAHRTTVTHLAGPFGHDGFPRPIGPSRTRRQLSRMSYLIAGIAVAVVVAVAGIIVAASGGSHPGHTAAEAAIGQPGSAVAPTPAASSTGASATAPSSAGASSTPNGTKAAGSKASPHAANSASRKPSSPQKTKAPAASPPSEQPAPPVTTAPPLPSPSPSPTPRHAAVLIVNPRGLSLVSLNDVPAQATFTITAFGGPIRDYTIVAVSSRGHLIATPVTGSLGPGQQARILVTGWGKASFTAQIHIYPGNHVVTVHVKATKSKG